MFKNLIRVGLAAGLGVYVGDKGFGLLDKHIPASIGPELRAGLKVGTEASTVVVIYSLLGTVL